VAALAVGRVCMKIAGREAGRYCVILKKLDENFFLITGPKILTGVKRRRCNVDHLEPTPFSIEIEPEASEKSVIEAYEKSGLLKKLGLKKPSPELVKELEKKAEKEEGKTKPKETKKEGKKAITIKIPTLKKPKKAEKKKTKKTKKRTEKADTKKKK